VPPSPSFSSLPPPSPLSPYPPQSLLQHPANNPQVHRLIAPRDQKYQSNFVEFRNNKIVYRRYAGLFFCACVDANDNELAYLEAIHFFVEVLDSFFGNVCELDLVFNFYKVCFCFDSFLIGGKGRARDMADVYRCTLFSTRCSWLARWRRRVNRLF